ncbi:MAG TPA: branched-chain amino acid aminotransferase [Anaeromyxobacter sp.]
MATSISVQRTTKPRLRPKDDELAFGKIFSDHMFLAEWDEGKGWHDARIVPYGPIALDPAAACLHYGQEAFEGMKAFRSGASGMVLFRPKAHVARLARTAKRLCMPEVPEALFLDGVKALLREDAPWLPSSAGTSLYVRPYLFATEPFLGVRPAKQVLFAVILSPVGGYFSGAARPLKIWVEQERSRAAKGGIGEAKAAANYVASLYAAEDAKHRGFDQVLWLDGAEHRFVEEIGTMNFFAKIGGKLVTPALEGSILPGVTRDCVLRLARDAGVPVEERKVELAELAEAGKKGTLEEVFGTGTASLVAPIGELAWEGGGQIRVSGSGALGERLRAELAGIQRGEVADRYGWLEKV